MYEIIPFIMGITNSTEEVEYVYSYPENTFEPNQIQEISRPIEELEPPKVEEQQPIKEEKKRKVLEIRIAQLPTIYEFPIEPEVEPNARVQDITENLRTLEPVFLRPLAGQRLTLYDEKINLELHPNDLLSTIYHGMHHADGRKKWDYRLFLVPVGYVAQKERQQNMSVAAPRNPGPVVNTASLPPGGFAAGGNNAALQLISDVPIANNAPGLVPSFQEVPSMTSMVDPAQYAMVKQQQQTYQPVANGSSFMMSPNDPRLAYELSQRPRNGSHTDPLSSYVENMNNFTRDVMASEQQFQQKQMQQGQVPTQPPPSYAQQPSHAYQPQQQQQQMGYPQMQQTQHVPQPQYSQYPSPPSNGNGNKQIFALSNNKDNGDQQIYFGGGEDLGRGLRSGTISAGGMHNNLFPASFVHTNSGGAYAAGANPQVQTTQSMFQQTGGQGNKAMVEKMLQGM